MSKRIYRSTSIQKLDLPTLVEAVRGKNVVVGVDVAKYAFVAAVTVQRQGVVMTVAFTAPEETRQFVALVQALGDSSASLAVAMEPTGTYGDPLRAQLSAGSVAVYRVSPKRVHDASEDFDGVPSSHDAKAAAIVAQQHWDGKSHLWEARSDGERALAAAAETAAMYAEALVTLMQRLEAKLARHFPEMTELLELNSATLLNVLVEFPSPARISASPVAVEALMKRVGRGLLTPAKRALVLDAARTSTGQPMIEEEARAVEALCREMLHLKLKRREHESRVEALASDDPEIMFMAPLVGVLTAAVLVAQLGVPSKYAHAAAYTKALGLNLKERSSGTQKGQLHITKRGPGRARALLFLAVLRLIQRSPVSRAWYQKKLARDGGTSRMKAVVAVMRKLAKALWHVAHGATFDARKLFDVRRLDVEAAEAATHHEVGGRQDDFETCSPVRQAA